MKRLERPLLVFDGECLFCRAWIARWRQKTGDHVDYAPSQEVGAQFPEVPAERFKASVVFIELDGRITYGAEAVFRSLAEAEDGELGLALYEHVPGFAPASEAVYRFVAAHRSPLLVLTHLLWGRHVAPPGERLTAWLFLRLIGAIWIAAFASLGVQITGLVGRDGVLPIAPFLAAVHAQLGARALWLLPTLSWWNASDAFLRLQCWLGAAAGALLLLGIAPVACLIVAWALYLSVSTAGQDFLYFQWDTLLLETTFLAILLAPLQWWSRPTRDPAPRTGAVWLLRWLLFRLMFSSAVVKFASGDPTWRALAGMKYHYQTQPLPPWIAWYAHHLPPAFQTFSCVLMLAIEGLVPFAIFLPRRPRIAAAAAIAFLQTLIVVTGNYGVFNLLALALCLLLLDDAVWPAWLRRRAGVDVARDAAAERDMPGRWPASLARPACAVLLVLSIDPVASTFRRPLPWLAPISAVGNALSPLHVVNSYGLFAVMTTTRAEIVVEGSADGVTWRPYEFRWKPGDVRRRPAFVAPHMPRLDWQMWFAALDPQHVPPWFAGLCAQLLLGSRPVLDLLATNPFPQAPPRFVRAELYDYRFTTAAERRATGAWWVRRLIGVYVPPIVLEGGLLRVVGAAPAR